MSTDTKTTDKPRRGELDMEAALERFTAALAGIVDAKLAPLYTQLAEIQAQVAAMPDMGVAATAMQSTLRELSNSLRILLPAQVIALRPEDVLLLAENAPGTPLVVVEEFRTPTVRWQKGHRVTAGEPLVRMYAGKLRVTIAQTDDSAASAAEVRRLIQAEAVRMAEKERSAAVKALSAQAAEAEARAVELKAAADNLTARDAAA